MSPIATTSGLLYRFRMQDTSWQKRGVLFVISTAAITPAVAQGAKSLLEAADRAMGASAVKSVVYFGASTMHYPGQSYEPDGDRPRAPMTPSTATIEEGSKSSKEEYAVDMAKKTWRWPRSPRTTNFVGGNYESNLNAQGRPNPQATQAEVAGVHDHHQPLRLHKGGIGVEPCHGRGPLFQP
jgi:hypothetical protein